MSLQLKDKEKDKEKAQQLQRTNKTAQNLSQALADTYILYLKTQNFHWNLVDPRFYFLHRMLEEQYEALGDAVDVIAEQLRYLGVRAPASMQEFLKLTSLKESTDNPDANTMIERLYRDHETAAQHLRSFIDQATEICDFGSADMFTDRLRFHEKTAWLLRSHFTQN